jgi:hypothetical protein
VLPVFRFILPSCRLGEGDCCRLGEADCCGIAGPVAALPHYFSFPPSHCHPSWASSARVWRVVSLVIRVAWRALRLLHRSMLPEKNPPRAATLSTSTLTDGEEFVAVLRQRRRRQSGLHLQMTNMCCYDSCP